VRERRLCENGNNSRPVAVSKRSFGEGGFFARG
jgi:hypothetical protein